MTKKNKTVLICCLVISVGSVLSNNSTVSFQTVLAVSMSLAGTIKAFLTNSDEKDDNSQS